MAQKSRIITLGLTAGSSDKTYKVKLQKNNTRYGNSSEGWIVEAYYGRRYYADNYNLKTPEPVDYYEAEEIFHKLVESKKRKGYVVEEEV